MFFRRVLACLVTLFALLGASSTATAATPAYQIAFSNNCNNPSVCFDPQVAGSLGGDWGTIRLDSDGTGTAQLTMATHSSPGIPTGAQHLSLVLVWTETSTPPATPGAPDPNGNYLVITVVNIPSLGSVVAPATPGHYKFQGAMLGMPGVNFMLQINAI